jgi:hypothetical protein
MFEKFDSISKTSFVEKTPNTIMQSAIESDEAEVNWPKS